MKPSMDPNDWRRTLAPAPAPATSAAADPLLSAGCVPAAPAPLAPHKEGGRAVLARNLPPRARTHSQLPRGWGMGAV